MDLNDTAEGYYASNMPGRMDYGLDYTFHYKDENGKRKKGIGGIGGGYTLPIKTAADNTLNTCCISWNDFATLLRALKKHCPSLVFRINGPGRLEYTEINLAQEQSNILWDIKKIRPDSGANY